MPWPGSMCFRERVALLLLAAAGILQAARLTDLVKAGAIEDVRAALKNKVDVNAPDPDGTTALAWAVEADNAAIAQLLLRSGANPNAANRYGVTPLSLAATNRNATIV